MKTTTHASLANGQERPPRMRTYGQGGEPLPLCWIQRPGGETDPCRSRAGFDFCSQIRTLCDEVVSHCPSMYHIDMDRVLIDVTQARGQSRHGLQARLTPLRFANGRLYQPRPDGIDQVQRYLLDGREMFYLLTFCLPRFLNQSGREKLITLFHELFHIHPAFDGSLRRLQGRSSLHSGSRRAYDHHMATLAREFLEVAPHAASHEVLRSTYEQLCHSHGGVWGVTLPRPKVIPLRRSPLATVP